MRSFATAGLALCGALLVFGCSSGTGPATPPFNPFGTDPSGSSSEPSGASNEAPPAAGGQTISSLCSLVCGRFEAACPATTMTNCAGSCSMDAVTYPNCVPELQAFLDCAESGAITCTSSGAVSISACTSTEVAFANCLQSSAPGTAASLLP